MDGDLPGEGQVHVDDADAYLIDSNVVAAEHHHGGEKGDMVAPQLGPEAHESSESGTEEERTEFMSLVESFCKQHALDFKPPKFYGEPLKCLEYLNYGEPSLVSVDMIGSLQPSYGVK